MWRLNLGTKVMKGLVSKGNGMLCWYEREFGNDTNDGGLCLKHRINFLVRALFALNWQGKRGENFQQYSKSYSFHIVESYNIIL